MTKYKCGHECELLILDGNGLSYSDYLDWKDSVGYDGNKTKCWECYCKKKNRTERIDKGFSQKSEKKLIKNVELASKIVIAEDKKLLRELAKEGETK